MLIELDLSLRQHPLQLLSYELIKPRLRHNDATTCHNLLNWGATLNEAAHELN